MTKKDVLIFLNIYLLAVKYKIKSSDLDDFRDEVYRLLSESLDYSEFWRSLCRFKSCSYNSYVYKDFFDYMSRVEKVLDIKF